MRRIYFYLLILCAVPNWLCAQQIIKLNNPSFEDLPRHSSTPKDWYNCGGRRESPPDILPAPIFQVSTRPADGNTYLGLVVRDNGTWEAVGQELSTPLTKGQCYEMQLQVARSPKYMSMSPVTSQFISFDKPTQLRIWGGNSICDRGELLVESYQINNTQWQVLHVLFQPSADYTWLIFEAYFALDPNDGAYCGNLLLDELSPIKQTNCKQIVNLGEKRDTLFVQYPASSEDLPNFIRQYGSRVSFVPGFEWLHTYSFLLKDGIDRYGNQYLVLLINALKRFPEYSLHIGIVEPDVRLARRRARELGKALTSNGLDASRFKIITDRKYLMEAEWLWVPFNHELVMDLKRQQ